jgi:hypothetical protein
VHKRATNINDGSSALFDLRPSGSCARAAIEKAHPPAFSGGSNPRGCLCAMSKEITRLRGPIIVTQAPKPPSRIFELYPQAGTILGENSFAQVLQTCLLATAQALATLSATSASKVSTSTRLPLAHVDYERLFSEKRQDNHGKVLRLRVPS